MVPVILGLPAMLDIDISSSSTMLPTTHSSKVKNTEISLLNLSTDTTNAIPAKRKHHKIAVFITELDPDRFGTTIINVYIRRINKRKAVDTVA
jgi:hypothetical protein